MAASPSVSITYVPADCGSVIPGKSKAPDAFRSAGIVQSLLNAGISSATEHHALSEPARYAATESSASGVRNERLNVEVCERVRDSVSRSLAAERKSAPPFQLILGGECCMLPGILAAFTQHHSSKRVGLIYIDADTDLSTPKTSTTGTFAGMNMCHLLRTPGALDSMHQFSRPNSLPVCDSQNVVFFGTNMALSSNTRDHLAYLFSRHFRVIPASSVARDPVAQAASALRYLEERVDVILVHLDVDSIDPGTFPLANVPNYTGVNFEAMMQALKVFLASGKVAGLCVAEVNPDHDPELEMVERLSGEIVGMLGVRKGGGEDV
jgi:arginase